jgi:hypothetical protein
MLPSTKAQMIGYESKLLDHAAVDLDLQRNKIMQKPKFVHLLELRLFLVSPHGSEPKNYRFYREI